MNGITDSMDMSYGKLQEMVKDGEAWRAAVHGVTKESDMTEQLSNEETVWEVMTINLLSELGMLA